jgi:Carboxypeptidase regulatory-like domain
MINALRIALIVLCLLGPRLVVAQDQPPIDRKPASSAGLGSISGVVTKRPSGEAAVGAVVKILNEPFGGGPPGAQTQTATAGADGSFVLTDIEPGTYWLVANLQGFLPVEYGQRSPTGVGTSFDVRAGQHVTVRLALWPTSGISGRVIDADGDPVARVQVLALQTVYDAGKPSLTIAQTVMTNDRGEYRTFWLAPGSYRVAARSFDAGGLTPIVNISPPRRFGSSQQGSGPVLNRQTLNDGAVSEEVAVPIYAPSTPDPQLAATIALAPGEHASNVDVQLVGHRVPAYHVRGVLRSVSPQGSIPPQAQVLVVSRVPSPMATVPGANVRPDGSFDVPGVAAGSYIVYLRDGTAATPIEVGDSDLDNVVLTETAGVDIAGRLTIERGAAPGAVEMSNLRFQITREPEVMGAPPGGPRFNPPPTPDGTFTWTISPGDYRVGVLPLINSQRDDRTRAGGGPPVSDALQNAYVKSIRWGRTDVLADGLHTWGGGQATLEIVVSLAGAEVEGIVRDNSRQAAGGVIVVAVPDGGNRGRPDLYRHGTTDTSGRFVLRGLAPGDYSFYAWDDLERGAWESVEFLRGFEGRGRFVRLREGKNEPLDLNLVVGR